MKESCCGCCTQVVWIEHLPLQAAWEHLEGIGMKGGPPHRESPNNYESSSRDHRRHRRTPLSLPQEEENEQQGIDLECSRERDAHPTPHGAVTAMEDVSQHHQEQDQEMHLSIKKAGAER